MPNSFSTSTSLVEMHISLSNLQGANGILGKYLRVALQGAPWPVENKTWGDCRWIISFEVPLVNCSKTQLLLTSTECLETSLALYCGLSFLHHLCKVLPTQYCIILQWPPISIYLLSPPPHPPPYYHSGVHAQVIVLIFAPDSDFWRTC